MNRIRVDPELELKLDILELEREFGLDLEVHEQIFEFECCWLIAKLLSVRYGISIGDVDLRLGVEWKLILLHLIRWWKYDRDLFLPLEYVSDDDYLLQIFILTFESVLLSKIWSIVFRERRDTVCFVSILFIFSWKWCVMILELSMFVKIH